ncbi:MAG: hypothetical protein ACK444_02590 [Flavobacteriales bacterium]
MRNKNLIYGLMALLFFIIASCSDINKSSKNESVTKDTTTKSLSNKNVPNNKAIKKQSSDKKNIDSLSKIRELPRKDVADNQQLKKESPEKKNIDNVSVIRDSQRKDIANVFWKRKFTLFDLITDEPIFPVNINDQKIYEIYYSSNEDPNPHKGAFTETQLENHFYYKFKNKSSCMQFCESIKRGLTLQF